MMRIAGVRAYTAMRIAGVRAYTASLPTVFYRILHYTLDHILHALQSHVTGCSLVTKNLAAKTLARCRHYMA